MRTKPDDNGSNYVAYIWKRPNQGQKRWEQRGQSILFPSTRKSRHSCLFSFHIVWAAAKKNVFNNFTRKCQKWSWLRKDIVRDSSGTGPGQVRDRSGQVRDRSGTGPGQVRDRSGASAGRVWDKSGIFLKFSENFWNFVKIFENFWDFLKTLKISENVWRFLKFSEFFVFLQFSAAFRKCVIIWAPHSGVPGRLAKIWFWAVGVSQSGMLWSWCHVFWFTFSFSIVTFPSGLTSFLFRFLRQIITLSFSPVTAFCFTVALHDGKQSRCPTLQVHWQPRNLS